MYSIYVYIYIYIYISEYGFKSEYAYIYIYNVFIFEYAYTYTGVYIKARFRQVERFGKFGRRDDQFILLLEKIPTCHPLNFTTGF
jgi:hypothetical protein